MIRNIVPVQDKRIRTKSTEVKRFDKSVKRLITDLKDTLNAQKDPEGVGLAAPQIGVNKRVFVAKPDENTPVSVFVNPKIISVSQEKTKPSRGGESILEGCLSLPHYYGPIERSREVTLRYLNEEGKEITKTFKDFESQIILHEIDHLEGIIFVDRLLEQKKSLYQLIDDDWYEVDLI